ncbi:uncharacterized protein TOT_010000514 [Theileria orientalis strain Shintoku]|uniref:Uncharacterized protein n=1 Tax=Theileria orientalis strain Shintoku TaxID=869250 RepID=J4C2P5_THEOR|nr:uncharacterized protein TOT_010000514 [Theileria orientalis strain Shintoku]BAM39051.1 uncharacterized protein TOT_010000514 [Theileria orientalis strain Shintoku]|eukprot:XP_009689352.1 uncharacterized protein TOT_010000514 [Theileria orientalis strain Shintoku]
MHTIIALKYFLVYILCFYSRNLAQSRHPGGYGGRYRGAHEVDRFNYLKGDFEVTSVNLDVTTSTNKIHYRYDTANDEHVYTARRPYLIYKVRDNYEVFWVCNDGNYAMRVVLTRNEDDEEVIRLIYPTDFPESRQDQSPEPKPAPKPRGQTRRDKLYPYLTVLNLRNRHCTQLIEYEYDQAKNTHTFTAVSPYRFGIITKGTAIEWEAKTPEFPDKVFIFPDGIRGYIMRLFFPPHAMERGFPPMVPVAPEKISAPVDGKPPKPKLKAHVELNVEHRRSTDMFDFIEVKDKMTFWKKTYHYTAKEDYKFNEVRENMITLWKAKSDEVADKVSFTRVIYGYDEIVIHIVNGPKVKFLRTSNPLSVGDWREDHTF